MAKTPPETEDLICGELTILQARKGYRFGVESLLLPAFAQGKASNLVDLGCGSGIMTLLLVRFYGVQRAVGIEIQKALAGRARRNVERNGLSDRIEIIRADLRALEGVLPPGRADLVVANPPYRKVQSGKVSRGDERALGRHEVLCELPDVVSAASRLLEPRGRMCMVYPVGRLPELLRTAEDHKLRPARLRMVYGRTDLPPKNCLLEAVRNGRMSLKAEAPLIMYDSSGEYTEEVKVMLYPEN